MSTIEETKEQNPVSDENLDHNITVDKEDDVDPDETRGADEDEAIADLVDTSKSNDQDTELKESKNKKIWLQKYFTVSIVSLKTIYLPVMTITFNSSRVYNWEAKLWLRHSNDFSLARVATEENSSYAHTMMSMIRLKSITGQQLNNSNSYAVMYATPVE